MCGFVLRNVKKHRRGRQVPVFLLCFATETGVAVGIISNHLEYWNNQITLLRYSTYYQPEMMLHLARFRTDIAHLYAQMDRLRMYSYRMFDGTYHSVPYQKYYQTGFQGLMSNHCNQKRWSRTYNLLVRQIDYQIIHRGLRLSNLCNHEMCR